MSDRPQRHELGGGLSATLASDYAGTGVGAPLEHTPEVVEQVLWEVAVCGGNAARAIRQLNDHALDEQTGISYPRPETVRRWIKGRFRNRYFEICQARSRELEEHMAARQMERAVRQDEMERDLMDQIAGRIGGLDAVEASTVLRNVNAAKKNNVDGALGLRRQKREAEDSRSLRMIGEGLRRLGVAEFVDSTAEEEGEGQTPSLPESVG